PDPQGALPGRHDPARALERPGPRDRPEAEARSRQAPERTGEPGGRPQVSGTETTTKQNGAPAKAGAPPFPEIFSFLLKSDKTVSTTQDLKGKGNTHAAVFTA